MEQRNTPLEQNGGVSAAQLGKINQYARRTLKEDEVYVFSLVLCDNEVDRDFERFPTASLEKLAELFLGRTGIFDHSPKGENQTARIFQTQVVSDPARMTRAGEPYSALRAWAYMVRCEKNRDLILEIDAGIKKEVSVGCAVAKKTCSICGADLYQNPCSHLPGKQYGELLCWQELETPTDAYEWSFVAVPAQKEAGVTKKQRRQTIAKFDETLQKKLQEMEAMQQEQMDQLRKQFFSLCTLSLPELESQIVQKIAAQLDTPELKAFCHAFGKHKAPFFQLWQPQETEKTDNQAFRI